MEAARELTPRVGVSAACRAMALPRATYYRRLAVETAATESDDGSNPSEVSEADENLVGKADPRPPRRSPRALKEPEEQKVLAVLHSERFVDRSPGQVYATLLDEGSYLCSERTMYRILEKHQEVKERRNQRKHPTYTKPELLATGPNEVWSWDITKLRGPVKWTYFYLYVILDIFSRYVVGWMVATRETAALAKQVKNLGWKRALVIDGASVNEGFLKAARNIEGLDILPTMGANVYDILKRDTLVITKAGIEALEARLK